MKVRLLPIALEDVDRIYRWLAVHSEEFAARVEEAVLAATDLLGEHPEFGTITNHEDVRRWPMTDFRYTIFYFIDWEKDRIDILRIIDARRVRDLKRVPKGL